MLCRIAAVLILCVFSECHGSVSDALIKGVQTGRYGISNINICGGDKHFTIHDLDMRPMDNGNVEFKGVIDIFRAIDNNNKFKITLEQMLPNNKTKPILALHEKEGCKNLLNYGGALYTEVLKAAGVPKPEECPLPTGHYGLDWYEIDVTKAPIYNIVPTGIFKGTIEVTDQSNDEELLCLSAVWYKNPSKSS